MTLSGALHPSPDLLVSYAQGRCEPAECPALEHHLETCRICCVQLETAPLDALEASLRGLSGKLATRGQLVAGYELLEEIGAGGSGVVYVARQVALQRIVALKRLKTGVLASLEARHRFRQEAEVLAALRHPHIVQVLDFGEHLNEPFLVMEYVQGWPLSRLLSKAPLEPRPAARLIATVARALQAAHAGGVIHRDLKPQNILLGIGAAGEDPTQEPPLLRAESAGDVRVIDFGLAKPVDADVGLTRTGTIMGTPGYLAPEQLTDAGGGNARVDVYGMGATLYECLTGRPPFLAPTAMETMQQANSLPPPPPRRLNPRIPRDLQTICLKCLEKEPHRRYARAKDLADDLERFLEERPITARPASPLRKTWLWMLRHPARAALIAVLVLTTLAGIAGIAAHSHRLRLEIRQTTLQRNEAQRQRTRADQNYQRAREALRSILGKAQHHGSGIPRLLELTQAQAEDAVAFLNEMALADQPVSLDVLQELANMYTLLGNVRLELGRVQPAREAFQAAHHRAQQLYARTSAPEHVCLYAASRIKLGIAWMDDPPNTELALVEFNAALELLEPADQSLAKDEDVANTAAWCRHNLGQLYWEQGDLNRSERLYTESVRTRLRLADRHQAGKRRQYMAAAADTAVNLGLVLQQLGRLSEAETAYGQAERALKEYETASDARHEKLTLAAAYVNWSNILLAADNAQRAIELTSRGIDLIQPILALEPSQVELAERLVSLRGVRAQALMATGQFELAAADWGSIPELHPASEWAAYGRLQAALIYVRHGQIRRAMEMVDALGQELSPDDRYNLACVMALAAGHALADSASEQSSNDYRSRAVDLLEQLAAANYFSGPRQSLLREDADLDLLRGDARFQELQGRAP